MGFWADLRLRQLEPVCSSHWLVDTECHVSCVRARLCHCVCVCCRLANTPLETAYELHVVASMTQLVQLELGVIFDGSSTQHDVPRALASLGSLHRLQVGFCGFCFGVCDTA